ncbi:MAG: precorrin-2 C(20)-methyltransferase [Nitrospina sp.]|jgi:precorrin-2/cobalt-factor-2 C20-methyltransferase|nr:precorrin-2 C(20)-methyltransferase [Nitrospina sp.]MBT3511363.1 precorrin-2 C(20)-methyltransferase [Nitrospina sp.]MBT3875157.1 precorrin-2 C(20)-methyltransferase [Nitrospina sp.]MBT4047413.1 precorrin-2 C(20)-methyltransferase [Nitrospina sp.]MBT4556020.1 precorrin-2 C(20)-methyltransferase [Nitrospina sp.]
MIETFGTFTGIGVGPGPQEFLTLKSFNALMKADKVLVPRAKGSSNSVALTCIKDIDIQQDKIEFLDYPMSNDESLLSSIYLEIAAKIIADLKNKLNLVYITIGDPYIYSTYSYTVNALKELMPEIPISTYPGISSFQALSAALNFPLGQGKEKILILPCPETPDELRGHIEKNENIVLMKIGDRFDWVRNLLSDMDILEHCALGKRIGLDNEILTRDLIELNEDDKPGYLSVVLIRKFPAQGRIGH